MNTPIPQVNVLPNFVPDIYSAIRMLAKPDRLFEAGNQRGNEIFSFRIMWEKWFVLMGEEANRFFFALGPQDVDPFALRVRMPALHLPHISPPSDLMRSTRITKRLLSTRFAQVGPHKFVEIVSEETNNYIAKHLSTQAGTISDFFAVVLELCIRIIARMLLGDEVYSQLPGNFVDLYKKVETSITRTSLVLPWLPNSTNRAAHQAKAQLANALRDLIKQQRREDPQYGPAGLIKQYLTASDEESGQSADFSDEQIVWLINSIQWAAHHYPAVHGFWLATKIFTESWVLDDVLAEQSRFPSMDMQAIRKMTYLQGCVRESLRLHSLVVIPRVAMRDLRYKGYQLRKGSIISISPYLNHRDPRVYENPHAFNPRRWTDPTHLISSSRFIPGGAGTWGCIGMHLTITMLTTIWAILLRRFTFKFACPVPELPYQIMLLAPPKPIAVQYQAHKHTFA